MDLQEDVRPDSVSPEAKRVDLSSSSFDMIFGGVLSNAQQQLERAFQELRDKSGEVESALEEAREQNRLLERRNAELLAEAAQAKERAARLEAAARSAAERATTVLKTLAGALSAEPVDPPADPEGARSERSTESAGPQSESEVEEEPDTAASGQSEHSDETLDTGGEPGMTHLVASPFESLAAVLRFQREVKQVPGVTDVKPVDFDNGTVRLAVWYSSELTHLGALLELDGYDMHIVPPTDAATEVSLGSSNGNGNGAGQYRGLRAS